MFASVSKPSCATGHLKTILLSAKWCSSTAGSGKQYDSEADDKGWRRPRRLPWVGEDGDRGSRKYDDIIGNETPKSEKFVPVHPLDYIRDENRKPDFHRPMLMQRIARVININHPYPQFGKRMKNLMHWMKFKDQLFRPERLEHLGPDLAAAHFIVCRGGGVKFVGENRFVRSKINKSYLVLPGTKDDSYKVEAIDASKMNLLYAGLKNISDLKYLKWISFSGCSEFDNWHLDYVSSIAPNIEYLDISFCKKVDHLGFGCFYRFRKLQCANVDGISDSDSFKLACLTLESEKPNLVLLGIPLKKRPKTAFSS